ncbi:hypothetical protein EJ02DRAFT_421727 [Clathrospora elynae]|uniref:PAT1 multi-domain protein n=1 Tax=Clathrospora elynae TaxID=706981 RepID=A0A6A5SSX4_9PLEO|nr:hypothetical protein EJ02DRAFT_421727 [Clathrospora elynae]
MPQKYPWSKSDRSHHSVDTLSSEQPSPVQSGKEEFVRPIDRAADEQALAVHDQAGPLNTQQPPVQQQTPADAPHRQYREEFPQRITSHRLSAHFPLGQSSQNYPQQPGPPQPSPGLELARRGSHQPKPSPALYAPEQKRQSLRSRIAAGVRGYKDEDAKQAPKNGLGRRQTVRKSDPRAQDYPSQEHSHLHASPQWPQHQGSSPHLPTSNEHEEDNLDPFLQQDDHDTPQVPPKDIQYQPNPQQSQQPQQPQQFAAHPHPEQYSRAPLSRVSTEEGSSSTHGGVDQYSPDQHQSQGLQQPPPQPAQPQRYQSYQPVVQHPQGAHDYQAFSPLNAPSPLPQNGQHNAHYFQQQQQPELQHPQATRQLPQIVQPPTYQTYDAQKNKQSHPSDLHPPNTTPPQQGQDNMAPSAPSNARNTMRKVNDGIQPQPGAPSRDPSFLQQPPAQGQPLGQQPVSPGLATFDANVVPTASQGQPYRGEKQGQQGQQLSDMGQATPPPRSSATDMTEEELEKMMKEHEVLREKYQKVKRYFFEQQTQVHQLQNTLANQRLSLSRTSWDDSEYATRFNRLDGLIAQLSFSIRKEWKSIPQWLQAVVNRTAVETGKQEMTAVGRAFISHWLVENIFEKYFHPDLEPGFSTQLQSIVTNIRKFSPPCHSAEDEESLAAKIINWRLATLEGLADTLKAPQAAVNRQILTDTLNEKLLASLQMYLNDPAPADLNGGVPMIIELAISVAQHMPLESREVHIEYFPPGHGIVTEFMKMESGIPALTAPIMELDEADRASVRSVASRVEDGVSIADLEQQNSQTPKDDKKRGMFGFGASKKPTTAPTTLGKRESSLGQGGSQQSLTQNPPGSSSGPKDESPPPRVRMAVGVAVQIRGKSILCKAPVYST